MRVDCATAERLVPYSRRLSDLAADYPDRTALTIVGADRSTTQSYSYLDINRGSEVVARELAAAGVSPGWLVVVGYGTCLEHVLATYAAWKLGACVLPIAASLPAAERDRMLGVAEQWRPYLLVQEGSLSTVPALDGLQARTDVPEEGSTRYPVPNPGKAMGSGGSSGTPKIIIEEGPHVADVNCPGGVFAALRERTGFRVGQTHLIPGPLYHNAPFSALHDGLFARHHVILMQRFDADAALTAIDEFAVQYLTLVPTMMQRMLQSSTMGSTNLESVEGIWHTGGPCPRVVKEGWIAAIGAERVYEAYGSTDVIGYSVIRGDEWRSHPGSVGRPVNCDVRVIDESGQICPPGVVGEIQMRLANGQRPPFRYVGSPPLSPSPTGFYSVGDFGWLDRDGYLYIADRRSDLIVCGGANVYPAEVENAIAELDAVADVVVIGLDHPSLGKVPHAVLELRNGCGSIPPGALSEHLESRLASYKQPRSYQVIDALPRNDAGKIRRPDVAALAARTASAHIPLR